jgi:endonuclease V-like protein UPF0215 family
MTRSLTVKKEIRTLGLDLCNPRRLVGAVTRGGDYLDGVLVLPSKPTFETTWIASAIMRTRFFPELRLIMTHDSKTQLDPMVIERFTKLPVVQVNSTRKRRSSGFKPYKVGQKQLLVKSTLSPSVLQEILSTTWATGIFPEPIRIAHLLARSRFSGKNARFKANK